jgi:hypothetical protein
VSGNGDYTASSGTITGTLTPTQVGTYYWTASYTGDAPNTLNAATGCGDTGEASTVTDTTSVLTDQTWVPNDQAQITSTGGSALNGSVVFTLYNNATCDAGTNNTNVLYTSSAIGVFGTSSQYANSANTVRVSASQSVSWKVAYTSNTTNISGSTSSCEVTSVIVNQEYTPLHSPLP